MRSKISKYHVELTPELLSRAEEQLQLWQQGRFVHGVDDQFSPDVRPAWFDEKRYLDARRIVKDIYSSVSLSSLTGLMYVIQLPKGLSPLLATGQSKNTSSLFNRYLSTALHVNAWYTDDIFDPNCKSGKSARLVRSLHKRAGQMMNKKYPLDKINFESAFYGNQLDELQQQQQQQNDEDKAADTNDKNNNQGKAELWVNQFDMLLTQWAFIGPMLLDPYGFGVHGHNINSLELIIYLWRVIGYAIGIKDEYNLFTQGEYDFTFACCKLILDRIYAPALADLHSESGAQMGLSITKGMRSYSPFVRHAVIMRHSYGLFNIDATRLNRLMDDVYEKQKRQKQKSTSSSIPSQASSADKTPSSSSSSSHDENNNSETSSEMFEKVTLRKATDYFFAKLLAFDLNYMLRSSLFRRYAYFISHYRLQRALRNRDKLRQKWSKKYDDFEAMMFDRCPFSNGVLKDMEYKGFETILPTQSAQNAN